jgi:hypothetical protein
MLSSFEPGFKVKPEEGLTMTVGLWQLGDFQIKISLHLFPKQKNILSNKKHNNYELKGNLFFFF